MKESNSRTSSTLAVGVCQESPLVYRYAGEEMVALFSQQTKYSTWRKLWLALAEAQKELGLNIKEEQLEELRLNIDNIDFSLAKRYEKQFGHDVVAHIYAFSDLCPKAKPIIHLGATSCYVTDNADLIMISKGLFILLGKLKKVIEKLSSFAKVWSKLPCLGFTHLQPAQLTTVGKRACLWLQDFLLDLKEIHYRKQNILFLGAKGTTGTQASFLYLFDGDDQKVRKLDLAVAKKMGFHAVFPIAGQTYTRKQDTQVLQALASFAASAHKMATDIRLLSGLKEIEEPFGKSQVGSSAMPYKKNPILSERICSLSRFLIALSENPIYTQATQWLERTLDDSANRRLSIPEAFLAADAILELLLKVIEGLGVNKKVIERHVAEELPFMAAENILMASVKKGGDRQDLHEKIRVYSLDAAKRAKEEGLPNNLLEKIAEDPAFPLTAEELKEILNVEQFIGIAPKQVEELLKEVEKQIAI